MRKKAAKSIQLVLITSVLASCSQPKENTTATGQKVYMRADSTAQYTDVSQQYNEQRNSGGPGMGSALLWYMAFRHLGGGLGYANNNLSQSSIVGKNAAKANAAAARGGFGKSAEQRSSSSVGA